MTSHGWKDVALDFRFDQPIPLASGPGPGAGPGFALGFAPGPENLSDHYRLAIIA